MQSTISNIKKIIGFRPDIDQLESLGTQIQWKDIVNAEAGIVLLAAETDGPPIHYHPRQEEEFFIRQGELMVYRRDRWIKLQEGDSITIPAKTPHTYKNASKKEVLFDFCISPRVRFREMIEEMDGYVQEQKIRGTDFKSVLYLCRVMDKYPDVTQSVKPPQFIVKLMAGLSRTFQK
ncbi:cupin domain-containing protein [Flavihumibacter rivuli]|uniref:cupin domain-containing protein n=1 Tax=Flavihumibacter rivuli TaxID=2838156 RepID=UPI001BDF0D95|nr:cupin domain-containing protein [Flavihumibacter rivuli]ULQ58311.1 cupin domain-containing protein [Flavihumibacter rivuli]